MISGLLASPALANKTADRAIGTTGPGAAGTGSGNGQLNNPQGVAVNEATGDLYVADATNRRVVRFNADGSFNRAWGWNVAASGPGDTGTGFEICVDADGDVCQQASSGGGAGQFATVQGIAVDQATGNVYVSASNRIQKFDADGDFLRMWGRDVVTGGSTGAEICTVAANCKAATSGALGGQLNAGNGRVAVDDAGNVYVAESSNRRISKFDSDGNFISAWGWDVETGGSTDYEVCTTAASCKIAGSAGNDPGRFGSSSPSDIAADTSGNVYAVDPGNDRLMRFDANGANPTEFAASELTGTPELESLAIDLGNDHVFVGKPGGDPEEKRFKEFDTGGTLVDTHAVGNGLIPSSIGNGLAYRSATGELFLSVSNVQSGQKVVVFDDDGGYDPGSAAIGTPTEIGAHTAELSGEVNPDGKASTAQFEVSKNGTTWDSVGDPIDVGSGTSDVPIAVSASGLEANQLYRARVVLSAYIAGSENSAEVTFLTDTVAPEVTTTPAIQVADASAVVRGRINANNLLTTYRFEYGTTTSYGTNVPVPDGSAGSDGIEERYSKRLTGLLEGATYHYRLCATNAEGTTCGDDGTFTTRPQISPDGERAYEMITPPFKNNRAINFFDEPRGVPVGHPGFASPDGEKLILGLNHGVIDPEAGTALPQDKDWVIFERRDDGWHGESIHDAPPTTGTALAATTPLAFASDFSSSAWRMDVAPFTSGSRLGTKVQGSTAGANGSGWFDWLAGSPALIEDSNTNQPDAATLSDDGQTLIRSGYYLGLLGPDDPSLQQLPINEDNNKTPGGKAIYRQFPTGTGQRELVNECTGAGAGATSVPMRDPEGTSFLPGPNLSAFSDDTIATMSCEAGEVTSIRGAVTGDVLPPFRHPNVTSMSEDGRRVFFMSPDTVNDTALDDAIGGPVPGSGGNGRTRCAGLSGNLGTGTFFENTGADTFCPPQLYVRQYDADGEATVRWISHSRSDAAGDNSFEGGIIADQSIELFGNGAIFEGAAVDGSVVYFRTNAPLTPDDPNGTGTPGPKTTGTASANSWDLYRYELPSSAADPDDGGLTRISGGPDGLSDPNVPAETPVLRYLSEDGSRAYFVTSAPIQGADNEPVGATTPVSNQPGQLNLYLYDESRVGADRWKFITTLPDGSSSETPDMDACASARTSPGLTQAYTPTSNILRLQGNNCVRGSSEGDLVSFQTTAQLTADDDDDAADIYAFETAGDRLTRVSAPPAGEISYVCGEGNGITTCNADFGFVAVPGYGDFSGGAVGLGGARHWNVSDDGAVYFETRLSLVEGDTNGNHYDVYQWRDGEVTLVSPGTSADHAYYSGNSRDGEDVFISTSQRISPWEIEDSDFDIYDARLDGGLPGPPGPAELCDVLADECQAASKSPPGADTPGSATAPSPETGSPGPDVDEPASCAHLAQKVKRLKRKIQSASGKRAKKLRKKVRKTKRELRACRKESK